MFYNYITNTLIFFVEKNEKSFCTAKASHIDSTEIIGIFQILMFKILTKMLTNDMVSFEQAGPGVHRLFDLVSCLVLNNL